MKWKGCAFNHLLLSNASCTSTPLVYVHSMGRDNFTFTLPFTVPFAILWFIHRTYLGVYQSWKWNSRSFLKNVRQVNVGSHSKAHKRLGLQWRSAPDYKHTSLPHYSWNFDRRRKFACEHSTMHLQSSCYSLKTRASLPIKCKIMMYRRIWMGGFLDIFVQNLIHVIHIFYLHTYTIDGFYICYPCVRT